LGGVRRYDTEPHARFGLGLERTIAYVTGLANVRGAIGRAPLAGTRPRIPRLAQLTEMP